jgi:hypothetical protein
MTVYSKELKNDSVKAKILMGYHGDNKSSYELSREFGISPRAIQMFIGKQTHLDWWMANEDIVDNYFNGFKVSHKDDLVNHMDMGYKAATPYQKGLSDLVPKHPIGVWPPYVSEEEDVRLFNKPKKILVIADTQTKPDESLDYMSWIGKYIWDKKPDVVVHIGDHYDFPSLSSYDKGKKSFEGRRLKADIEAGNLGMKYLTREFLRDGYKPRMVFCMGNHEDRFDRLKNDVPELDGFVGTELLPLAELGWEVYPFLKPVEIEGIFFVHYLANPMTGKPYAGTAANQLKTVGRSFVVGHKQVLDVAIRNTLDGKQQIGIINGACYPFDESYKGFQGNLHFRGVTMLHEVSEGAALPMFVSLEYMKNRYE